MPRQIDSSGRSKVVKKRLGNEARKVQVTEAITAKVLVLEGIAKRERPLLEGVPTTLTAFRSWVVPELGLVDIGSSTSTDRVVSPHNATLVDRAFAAMRQIANQVHARKLRVYVPVGTQLALVEEEKQQLIEEKRRLLSELSRFIHLANEAESRAAQAKADEEDARRDLHALRLEYLSVTNAKPRRVK